ncbi:MAG TPA: NADH-quinone oxidoreductase subunit NuoE [Ktedonobacterales bacterium]|nr:NADH-quinone oxidoreductase subunit NuoE [Ktedonobacterales bacterium]
MIGEEVQVRLREIVSRYPSARSAMLPCLHLVQEEQGYITPEGIIAVAEAIGAKPDEVESVVTFYSMYTEEPKGRCVIKVCTSIACYLRGCDDVLAHLEQRLGIRKGETSSDGRFTLEAAECLAACGMAPAMQVNGRFFENVTTESADTLVDYLVSAGDTAALTSAWQPVSDGRGMATVSRLDAASPAVEAVEAADTADTTAQQNGAHER